jgi:UDP-2,3-diacylglucosamine pyrophosphatase LpxH
MAKSKSLLSKLEKDAKTKQSAASEVETTSESDLSVVFNEDSASLVYHGDKINTVEELLAHAKFDLEIWEVTKVKVNNWEVAGKRKVSAGRNSIETLWKTPCRQISVEMKRKAPKSVQEAILALTKRMPQCKPHKATRKRVAKHLIEFSLYDCHFGKLCWNKQTKSDDYDLEIAASDYQHAVDTMIDRIQPYQVEEIILPIGNDFLHFDGANKQTTKGTLVDSTDDRYTKVFRQGFVSIRDAVEACVQVAPVRVLYVPGNHDKYTSWHLCEMLRHYFAPNKQITVENDETRKFLLWGKNLIGWDHGEKMSLDKLARMMPIEASSQWSHSVFRYMRVGHFHTKKQIRHLSTDTHQGIQVDVIPSLSATDAWHYENGYIGNQRAAEIAVWDREAGLISTMVVEAKSAIENRKKQSD